MTPPPPARPLPPASTVKSLNNAAPLVSPMNDGNAFPPSDRQPTPSPRPLGKWGSSALLVLLGAGLAAGGAYGWSQLRPFLGGGVAPVQQESLIPLGNPSDRPAPPQSPRNFVAQIAQEVGPAVVRIDASSNADPKVGGSFPFGGAPNSRRQGLGSGFIITKEGRILTNAHVVDGATTVQVTLRDGRTFEGRVVGADPVTDVAVVEIDGENLPTVPLADSDTIQSGEWAIAIGNPLGLDSTVTVGIISAIGRSGGQVGVADRRVDFLQTDAAINPGNSGGPLLNDRGQVIGMNTAIIQGAQGIGFAIPSNTVARIAEALVTTGRVDHPFIGIRMVTLNDENRAGLRQELGLDNLGDQAGILVVEVVPGSPAARGGLQPGDVITQVGGTAVTTAEEVQRQVDRSTIGADLTILVRRQGRPQTLTVQPAPLPPNS